MSAGNFTDSKYQANSDFIFPVRIQPETESLEIGTTSNSPPAGAVNPNLPTVSISASRRSFGVHPRLVTVVLTGDGLPDSKTSEYKEGNNYVIPVLSESVWDSYAKGQVGTYQGIPCKVVSKAPEIIK